MLLSLSLRKRLKLLMLRNDMEIKLPFLPGYIYIARYYWECRWANWHNWTFGPFTFYLDTDLIKFNRRTTCH